jgi:hypothetical protein
MTLGVLASVVMLGGCTSGLRVDYRGTWEGRRELTLDPSTAPDVATSLQQVVLVIDDQGRFDLLDRGVPRQGNIASTANGLRLEIDRVMGLRLESQPADVREELPRYVVSPNEDGTLTLRDLKVKGDSVNLKRAPKP